QGTATAQLSGVLTLAGTTHTVRSEERRVGKERITGSGGFDKEGVGTVVLSGANTNDYTGLTAVQAGTLELRDANALGATGVGNGTTVSGATLNVNGVTRL